MPCRPLAYVFLAALPWAAAAAPQAESAEECGIAADMAIVARSLAEEAVQQPKAATIMERIYNVARSERGTALMSDIIQAAYSRGPEVTSRAFAEDLFMTCLKSGGDLDLVLGKRS
jgi:hypothetical protein